MPNLDFYYDNKKVNEDIANWRDLEIEVTFDEEEGQGVIKSGALEFTGELAAKINLWNEHGMKGGPGIFEAPPFRIEVCGSGQKVFDGGINTAECTTSYECDKVIAPLRSNLMQSLNDRASSFSFAYLASLPINSSGKINQADYVLVPYVINSIPDYVNIMVAGLSLFILVRELKHAIQEIAKAIKELIGDVTMTVTSAISITAPTVPIGMAIGRVLVDIVRIVLLVTYIVFIIKGIIEMVLMIFNNLIQPVKYKKGMRVVDMFSKASAYLGFNFSSSLLTSAPHKNEVIVPRKSALLTNKVNALQAMFGYVQAQKSFDDNLHPASVGYPEMTFADLILLYETRFAAEVRVIGSTLFFETKATYKKFTKYTLPAVKKIPYTTNACELSANYQVIHALDSQDTNTYDQYEGTSAYMALSPNVVSNKRNILLKGFTDKAMNLALGKRKIKLNGVETLFSNIYSELYSLLGGTNAQFGSILTVIKKQLQLIKKFTGGTIPQINLLNFPANPFSARIGMLLLSSDFTGVDKVLIVDSTGRLVSNNAYLTSAKYLMDKFHYVNFAVRKKDSDGNNFNDHNQWKIYSNQEVPLCCEDYNSILDSNFIKTDDQKDAEVGPFVWNPYKGTARATYRVKEQYTNNLTNTYIIDGK